MRGYISAQISTEGGLGDDGLPVFDKIDWGELVKCKFIPNSYEEKKVYADGKFTDMAFTITTSDMSFEAEIIRLYDSRKSLVFEGKVKSLFELNAVRRIKIIV